MWQRYEAIFIAVGELVIISIEFVALFIIAAGSLWAVYGIFAAQVHHDVRRVRKVRIRLGNAITLALEFLIGADILRASVSPTWTTLGQLAVIVGLRALLTYLIDWETAKLRAEPPVE